MVKGVEIRSEDVDPDLVVFADRARFQQVVCNLLESAIQSTTQNGIVSVDARYAGPEIEVAVTDGGPGIPAAEQDRIFDRLYQLERHGFTEATGLGLAITKRLVEQHGGRLRVENVPGGGSRFRFTVTGA
jgi:signal transduction histidine kinase